MVTVGDRLHRRLREALLPGAGLERIGAELSRVIAPVVPHDALRCGVMNPASGWGVTSMAFWHGYEPDLGRALLTADGVTADVRERTRPAVAVAGLGLRPRDPLLGREPIGTELRLALRDARGVWGVLCLLRAADVRRRFDDADAARLSALAPALISALRGYVTAGPGAPAEPGPPPGMLVIGADDRVRATTSQARPWLDAMTARLAVPDWLSESSFASLAVAAREGPRAPRLCVPSVGAGWWTAIEAQPLGEEGDVAVVIQRATGALLLPSYCDWYGITARERQVIQQLQRGDAPKQIARAFDLSVHTVNDHLKAIFRKTGAAGRDELMAAVNA
ncbi:helix-turn-helix transcriptional regulator [Actinomadura decatromicini]|uniref:Helix-turn-helix transcriptional regulator n=1 Tax=Actinomadura decatromicini TaxID=2604572 RepID=A0A5D3FCG8_9ACTN|nr:helix-turn-helix transcriptional regulator [Actinomadura decatromicini]TYK46001.1 helix-turn-helix transcriptional regulator [Actinomadura decatromicini]